MKVTQKIQRNTRWRDSTEPKFQSGIYARNGKQTHHYLVCNLILQSKRACVIPTVSDTMSHWVHTREIITER
jgi:hypothetical protein